MRDFIENVVDASFNYPEFKDGTGTLIMLIKMFEIFNELLHLKNDDEILFEYVMNLNDIFERQQLTPTMITDKICEMMGIE